MSETKEQVQRVIVISDCNHRVIQPCWVCDRDTVQEYDPTDQLYYCQECGAPQIK